MTARRDRRSRGVLVTRQVQPDWMRDAACTALPPERLDIFFPSKGVSSAEARQICRGCSVDHDTCIAYGNAVSRDYGLYGGLAPGERRTWAARNAESAA